MRFVLLYHSVLSDWNHGNAHFLRGVASELIARGHRVDIYEPENGWSLQNLLSERGEAPLEEFASVYPELTTNFYRIETLDLNRVLEGADVVIVHEWNDPELIRRVGEAAQRRHCHLFFHDTHHRSVTDPRAMKALDLRDYEGVLAFGQTIADVYVKNGWARLAWVWHEAADTRHFHPIPTAHRAGDLVWIGNWGDDERSAELHEFLIDPVNDLGKDLGLRAKVYGVRYPQHAQEALRAANIEYGGWIANYQVPQVFARYAFTVHVPRRAYANTLVGIPTIRMFEALACGIPLICAPWSDSEKLFRPGVDYLVARDGREMREAMRAVISDRELAQGLIEHGLETIRTRHTCQHRVDELMHIIAGLEEAKRQMRRLQAAGV